MFRCRGIMDGVKPAAGSVSGAVLSSVEIQAPSFHPLVFVIFSLMDSRSPSHITPRPFRNGWIRRHLLRETLWRIPCSCGTWACCACARYLLLCSIDGHCGRAVREGRNLVPRLSLAT